MRRTWLAFVVALVIAGCTSAASSSPVLTPPSAVASASVQPGTSDGPPPTPDLTPGPAGCPPAGAILDINVYLATEPRCFGSSETAIVGYADAPSDTAEAYSIEPAWLGDNLPGVSVLRADATGAGCEIDCSNATIAIHVDPASGLTFDAIGQWVVVTGHLADPRSESCRYINPAAATSGAAPAVELCRRSFVLTSVRDERSTTWLGFCPTRPTISVAELGRTDALCFGSHDITVYGYARPLAPVDPSIMPSWLSAAATGANTLSQRRPSGSEGDECTELASACTTIDLHIAPGSAVHLPATAGWIVVTGHLNDPASNTCRYADGTGDPAEAYRFCIRQFVVTAVATAGPPASDSAVCPTARPIRLSEYVGTYPECFPSGDLRILAWLDHSDAFGIECPCVEPNFLWSAQPFSLWQTQPTITGDATGTGCLEGCVSMNAHVNPDAGLQVEPAGRWVIVTGHTDDPLSQSCHWVGGDGAPPATEAIRECAESFVVTAIEPAAAPAVAP